MPTDTPSTPPGKLPEEILRRTSEYGFAEGVFMSRGRNAVNGQELLASATRARAALESAISRALSDSEERGRRAREALRVLHQRASAMCAATDELNEHDGAALEGLDPDCEGRVEEGCAMYRALRRDAWDAHQMLKHEAERACAVLAESDEETR